MVQKHCVSKLGRVRINQNVIRVNHQFENIVFYLLVINEQGVIEIIGTNGVMLLKCDGFCVLYTHIGCTVNFNGELLVAREDMFLHKNFSPSKLLVNLDFVMHGSKPSPSIYTIDNMQSFFIIFMILAWLLFFGVRCCVFKCTFFHRKYTLVRETRNISSEKGVSENSREVATKL